MSGSTGKTQTAGSEKTARRAQDRHSYVYGVVPADVELTAEARGVGDPPERVTLVRHGDVAALVSDILLDRPLGRPDDLLAHQRLLDDTAAEVPVLPFRFGAVLTDSEAVIEELLRPNHDAFVTALKELEGRTEYVVKGRYVERVVIGEVLAEEPEAARLREEIRDLPEEATWDARIQLGQLVGEAVAAKRDADTAAFVDAVAPRCVAVAVREPTHEQDAVHVAVLVEADRQAEFEEVLDGFGERWAGRIDLRLLGPMAPYDFVTTSGQGG
ncbi:GvpL/GvpF family gas vesicle protein [Streptosporangium sp. CA-135522]|uniref:GvpL/GvpF family gas vesicle protein n=1 Tax=Streptosporangium sp. CA-135522 TaxID=3240072 RepID=UPI003D90AA67